MIIALIGVMGIWTANFILQASGSRSPMSISVIDFTFDLKRGLKPNLFCWQHPSLKAGVIKRETNFIGPTGQSLKAGVIKRENHFIGPTGQSLKAGVIKRETHFIGPAGQSLKAGVIKREIHFIGPAGQRVGSKEADVNSCPRGPPGWPVGRGQRNGTSVLTNTSDVE